MCTFGLSQFNHVMSTEVKHIQDFAKSEPHILCNFFTTMVVLTPVDNKLSEEILFA